MYYPSNLDDIDTKHLHQGGTIDRLCLYFGLTWDQVVQPKEGYTAGFPGMTIILSYL